MAEGFGEEDGRFTNRPFTDTASLHSSCRGNLPWLPSGPRLKKEQQSLLSRNVYYDCLTLYSLPGQQVRCLISVSRINRPGFIYFFWNTRHGLHFALLKAMDFSVS